MAKARRNAMDPAPWVAKRVEADGTHVLKGFLHKPNAEKWAAKGKRKLRRRNVFAGPFFISDQEYLGAGREIEMPPSEAPDYARNNGLGMQGFARYNPPSTRREHRCEECGKSFPLAKIDADMLPDETLCKPCSDERGEWLDEMSEKHGSYWYLENPRPVPWRGAKGQFSPSQRRFKGIQPYGRRNPLMHNNPSTAHLITLSNFLATHARRNSVDTRPRAGSRSRLPAEMGALYDARRAGVKRPLSAMELELRDRDMTTDSGLLDYIVWLKSGAPKAVGWSDKQIKEYLSLARKEASRRVDLKTSRIYRKKGTKTGFALKSRSPWGAKAHVRRRKRLMDAASEEHAAERREEWLSNLRGWQLAAHDLGVPFVGRKKEVVLQEIADELGLDDLASLKIAGEKPAAGRRVSRKARANARRGMSAGQWREVSSPRAQRQLERFEEALEVLEDQPEPERRRRLVRIAGRGEQHVGGPRRAMDRARRRRATEEFMEEELRKLRRNPG